MQTILPPSGNTIKILGKARSAEHGLRWMHYVLAQPVEGGVLVFHTLTRALLLLTPEEYAAPDNLPELRDGWFRVPQEMDDITALKVPHNCILHRRSNVLELFSGFIDLSKCRIGSSRLVL